ncbi:hypothetical protein Q4I30_007321, partial [Leishmania utingensis]
WRPAGRARW